MAEKSTLEERQKKLEQRVLGLEKKISALTKRMDEVDGGYVEPEPEPVIAEPKPRKYTRETRKPVENLGFKIFGAIGFFLILLGLFYFYQYAVDQGWINHAARIAMGVIFSLLIIGAGELARHKKYEKFSQLMTGGGLTLLYFTMYATYHFPPYRDALRMSLPLNSVLLFTVIIIGVFLSLPQNSMLLTCFAFFLGYITSFLAGGTHQMMISTVLLTIAMVFILSRREWPLALYPFAATYILYIIFYANQRVVTGALRPEVYYAAIYLVIIAALFIVLSFVMRMPTAQLMSMVTANATLSFLLGLFLVWQYWHPYRGLFTFALAGIYGLLAWKNFGRKNLAYAFGIIGITLFTVAIPIQLENHWITIAWAVQALLLIHAGRKLNSNAVATMGCILLAITAYKTFAFDMHADFGERTIGMLVTAVALFVASKKLHSEGVKVWPAIFGTAGVLLTTVLLGVEILDAKGMFAISSPDARTLILTVAWVLEVAALLKVSDDAKLPGARVLANLLLGVLVAKSLFYDSFALDFSNRTMNFLLVFVALAGSAWWQSRMQLSEKEKPLPEILFLTAGVFLVIITVIECVDSNGLFSALARNGRQVALTIAWALESIVFIIASFVARYRSFQLLGVGLFAVTVGKILLIDLGNIEIIYRVVVTVIVGLIALGVSFAYVRNKEKIQHIMQGK